MDGDEENQQKRHCSGVAGAMIDGGGDEGSEDGSDEYYLYYSDDNDG